MMWLQTRQSSHGGHSTYGLLQESNRLLAQNVLNMFTTSHENLQADRQAK